MKSATLNTEWGEIEISVQGGGYYGAPEHMLRCGEAELRFEPPLLDDPTDTPDARVRSRAIMNAERCGKGDLPEHDRSVKLPTIKPWGE